MKSASKSVILRIKLFSNVRTQRSEIIFASSHAGDWAATHSRHVHLLSGDLQQRRRQPCIYTAWLTYRQIQKQPRAWAGSFFAYRLWCTYTYVRIYAFRSICGILHASHHPNMGHFVILFESRAWTSTDHVAGFRLAC